MSEQTPAPSDPDREHSGGDPHHDPTQPAPETAEGTDRESGESEEESDDD
jgi:hypothetical protein